ncbi:MAG: hypothetical protein WBE40_07065 [Thermoplasmata archaeon]
MSATGVSVNASCPAGFHSSTPGYNPLSHDVYVANAASWNITVYDGGCNVVATIEIPNATISSVTFDPRNGLMYATNWSAYPGVNPGQVWMIHGLTVVGTIRSNLLVSLEEGLWDPNASMMLFSDDENPGSVTGIQGTTVVGSAPLGVFPQGMCYDPRAGTVWVTDVYSASVSILNASNPLAGPIRTVYVSGASWNCAFDPDDNLVYVVAGGSDSVSAFYGHGQFVGNVPLLGGSDGLMVGWDPVHHRIFVTVEPSGAKGSFYGLVTISGLQSRNSLRFPTFYYPGGFAFDAHTGQMYISAQSAIVLVS